MSARHNGALRMVGFLPQILATVAFVFLLGAAAIAAVNNQASIQPATSEVKEFPADGLDEVIAAKGKLTNPQVWGGVDDQAGVILAMVTGRDSGGRCKIIGFRYNGRQGNPMFYDSFFQVYEPRENGTAPGNCGAEQRSDFIAQMQSRWKDINQLIQAWAKHFGLIG